MISVRLSDSKHTECGEGSVKDMPGHAGTCIVRNLFAVLVIVSLSVSFYPCLCVCVRANKARRVFGSCAGSPATKSFACLQMCRQRVIQSLRAGYAAVAAVAAVASAWQTNKYHLDAAMQGEQRLSCSWLLVSTKVMCRHVACAVPSVHMPCPLTHKWRGRDWLQLRLRRTRIN